MLICTYNSNCVIQIDVFINSFRETAAIYRRHLTAIGRLQPSTYRQWLTITATFYITLSVYICCRKASNQNSFVRIPTSLKYSVGLFYYFATAAVVVLVVVAVVVCVPLSTNNSIKMWIAAKCAPRTVCVAVCWIGECAARRWCAK